MKRLKHIHVASAAVALSLALGATTGWSTERQLHSHEHGVSELKIAQEGKTVSFELEAPGDDIVGFEYAPKNDAEKKAINDALTQLKNPAGLFELPAGAGCKASDVDAEFETSKDHAGFHVKWSMACQDMGKAKSLTFNFFKAFPSAKEVEVEAIGSAGQQSAEVERDAAPLDLSAAFGN